MKKYMMFLGLGLVLVASVVYARRGAALNVFDSVTTHPLAGYGDQIIEPHPLEMLMLEGLPPVPEAGELDLFD